VALFPTRPNVGAIDYYSNDIINIFYTEGSYKLHLTDRLGLLSEPSGRISGVQERFAEGLFVLIEPVRGEDRYQLWRCSPDIRLYVYEQWRRYAKPMECYPAYTSVQVQDFNRAGEEAFMVKASYDFTNLVLRVYRICPLCPWWDRLNPATNASVRMRMS